MRDADAPQKGVHSTNGDLPLKRLCHRSTPTTQDPPQTGLYLPIIDVWVGLYWGRHCLNYLRPKPFKALYGITNTLRWSQSFTGSQSSAFRTRDIHDPNGVPHLLAQQPHSTLAIASIPYLRAAPHTVHQSNPADINVLFFRLSILCSFDLSSQESVQLLNDYQDGGCKGAEWGEDTHPHSEGLILPMVPSFGLQCCLSTPSLCSHSLGGWRVILRVGEQGQAKQQFQGTFGCPGIQIRYMV